jgi:hypothetical protein
MGSRDESTSSGFIEDRTHHKKSFSMSRAWLKVIGESKHPRERYEETFIGFPQKRRPRDIHVGDHMVLYAVGGSKNVFALV